MLIINFKTYKSGKEALKLAKICQKVDKNIIVAVQPTDIYLISKNTKLKVLAQHVGKIIPGRNTGFISPYAVKEAGAAGTFLNHSEHKLNFKTIKETVKLCKKIKLKTFIFTANIREGNKIAKLKPDYIIIEPPELVASKISVSKAKPKLIKNAVDKIKGKVLVGAGIHNNKDVKIAYNLGAKGVAVSSAVTKARNPENVLRDLLK